jgi:hypothetical protein
VPAPDGADHVEPRATGKVSVDATFRFLGESISHKGTSGAWSPIRPVSECAVIRAEHSKWAENIGKRWGTRVDLALDKAFAIIDRPDPYRGNVAPLTAECYSESRLSTRKIAGRELCVEPPAL